MRKKKKNSHYDQGKAVFEYKGAVKQSIYRFKYDNSREYAGFYAASAVENYSGWIQRNKIDAIVPVPMYSPVTAESRMTAAFSSSVTM